MSHPHFLTQRLALLTGILLLITGGLWSELAMYWPLPLAVGFLVLLASALFTSAGAFSIDK